jgi:chromosomal replication initiation ATPase DnaA
MLVGGSSASVTAVTPPPRSSQEAESAWQQISDALRHSLEPTKYSDFVRPLRPVSLSEHLLVLWAPNKTLRNFAVENFADQIGAAARAALGSNMRVTITVDEEAAA